MNLVFVIVALLLVALGLVQAWTIWYLKREIQRLEFRLGEALDDEDLLEFQERLRALLSQAKETASGLAQSVDQRRESLEKSLEKAKQAEKSLALRIVSRSAIGAPKAAPKSDSAAKRASKDKPKAGASPEVRAKPAASSTKIPEKPRPRPAPSLPRAGEPVQEGKSVEPGTRRIPAAKAAPSAPSRYQQIYDLADQGLSLEQISKESGVLAGEVDLILNLRRKEARP